MNTRSLFRSILCLAFAGCLSTADVSDPGADTSSGESHLNSGPMPTLPFAGGSGATAPWGGTNADSWRPEAVLANATSEALNTAWAMGAVKDVRVAVPVKLLDSGFNEFGDGQANAAPSFEWWSGRRPPVVATLVQFTDGTARIVFRFDRSLQTAPDWELRYNNTTVTLTTATTSAGDFTVTWGVPADLDLSSTLSTQALLVHPVGWRDWFPLWFRIPVRGVNELLATVPSSMRTFSADQGSIVDHEGVSSAANKGDGKTPYQRLTSRQLSSAYNAQPFNPGDIHAVFPWNGQTYVTGVGAGWTWVASQPPAPFKLMYTCFQRRQPSAEASAPNGGVPSGGGWHRIGDPAETILNDLESGPLVVGSGMNQPYTGAVPNGGGFAYNLTDVAVIRWLQPGEAFITRRGDGGHENYHWYYFSQSTEVCTEEWVHPTVPGDTYDFAPPSVNVTFGVDGAYTQWGENVFVVGDAPELGGWVTAHAVPLSPTSYPTWSGTVGLSKGGTVQFKFIKKDGSGHVTWEGGANRSLDVGVSDTSYSGSWQ